MLTIRFNDFIEDIHDSIKIGPYDVCNGSSLFEMARPKLIEYIFLEHIPLLLIRQ